MSWFPQDDLNFALEEEQREFWREERAKEEAEARAEMEKGGDK